MRNLVNHRLLLSVFVSALACSTGLQGTVILPPGVQQNIAFSTVTDTWGWTLAYQGTYNQAFVPMSTVFADVIPGGYIMYAARPVGSSTLTLLAAGPEAVVRTVTDRHQTTLANGVEWYYNAGSIGFAAEGQAIFQSSADVNSTGFGAGTTDAFGATRLSWHTNDANQTVQYGVEPVFLNPGWRAGETASLNLAGDWERLVFVAAIPEPGAAAVIFGLGALGLCLARRKRMA
ncbi:MAG: hypothetical protein JJT96_19020 [Opitutales bacterium]|nr:hypothetical protein [Opitutales bacterium]